MKKMLKTIAMILILVMLANSFTSCTLGGWLISSVTDTVWPVVVGILVDVIVVLSFFISYKMKNAEIELLDESEARIYMASTEYNPLTDYDFVMEKLNSLSETERASLMERFNSLPMEKRADLFMNVYSLPQAEIASSMERVNALSEAKLASLVQELNILSEADFDLLTDKIKQRVNFLSPAEFVAVAIIP